MEPMTEPNPDPRKIQAELEEVEEYQAPPREREQGIEPTSPATGSDSPIDVSLLEAQGGGHEGMSETKRHAAPDPHTTVSSKDELANPSNARATPPGERM